MPTPNPGAHWPYVRITALRGLFIPPWVSSRVGRASRHAIAWPSAIPARGRPATARMSTASAASASGATSNDANAHAAIGGPRCNVPMIGVDRRRRSTVVRRIVPATATAQIARWAVGAAPGRAGLLQGSNPSGNRTRTQPLPAPRPGTRPVAALDAEWRTCRGTLSRSWRKPAGLHCAST